MISFWQKMFSPAPVEADAAEPDPVAADFAKLEGELAEAMRKCLELDGLANKFRIQRDAARIERDTAQRERDGYRPDAIKFRALKSNLIPGGPYRGKGSKARTGAQVGPAAEVH